MSTKQTQEHKHKYKRVILGGRRVILKDGRRYLDKHSGYEIFKCMIPNCTHHIGTELAAGRLCQCWNCGEDLILSSENMRLEKPTHVWCRKTRERRIA